MENHTVIYSVVIPVYNSYESLEEITQRIKSTFQDIVQSSFEIVFVDDGSSNLSTWPMLEKLAKENKEVTAIKLSRNFGKPGAMICGFEHVSGEFVITIDDDLQQLPEDIPRLISKKEHDVVIGEYEQRRDSNFVKLTSWIKSWFDFWILSKPRDLRITPFKLYRRDVIISMLNIQTPFPFIPALIFYVTRDVVSVKIGHEKRKFGKTQFSFMKRVKAFSNLLVNNSSFLLRIIAFLGIIVSTFSFGLGILYFIRKLLFGVPVPGWTTIVTLMLFLNGMVLLTLGIIGEYLIRIITGIDNRPPYVIKTICRSDTF